MSAVFIFNASDTCINYYREHLMIVASIKILAYYAAFPVCIIRSSK